MTSTAARAVPDAETAHAIGVEAYTYLYPLVLMDLTRRQLTNVVHAGDVVMRAPANTFYHVPTFPPADFRAVVKPNFDTLYSSAFLDLAAEPQIVSVPEAGDRYYLLPVYDMWGEVFAGPGTRTTGSAALSFAVCPPGWSGELPDGVHRYVSPTPRAWIIGRTQARVSSYPAVHAFQAAMSIVPLSAWGAAAPEVVGSLDPDVDAETPPLRQVSALDAARYFAYAAELLGENGPHAQDYPILDRLATIGLRPGEPFDLAAADPVVRAALESAVTAARTRISEEQTRIGVARDGWHILAEGMGNYGTNYLRRATVELLGLGANLQEDAIYPVTYVDADGDPLTGERHYVWHFDKGATPPVRAFWSLTLYDPEGFQIANEINRFAINGDDDLTYNDDGSLDIIVQSAQPASGDSNWLPSPPTGPFNLCARFYYPEQSILDGVWSPPPIRRV